MRPLLHRDIRSKAPGWRRHLASRTKLLLCGARAAARLMPAVGAYDVAAADRDADAIARRSGLFLIGKDVRLYGDSIASLLCGRSVDVYPTDRLAAHLSVGFGTSGAAVARGPGGAAVAVAVSRGPAGTWRLRALAAVAP